MVTLIYLAVSPRLETRIVLLSSMDKLRYLGTTATLYVLC